MAFALTYPDAGRGALLLARLLVAAAGALGVWLLVRIFWLLVGGVQVAPLPRTDLPALADATAESGVALSVAKWHLFGTAASGPDPALLAQQAPATALQLQLRGTLNEHDPAAGIAFIADAQGRERAYRVGDLLPGDARLRAVYAGRVLLDRDGATESLSLRPEAGETAAPVRQPAASPAPGTPFVSSAMSFGFSGAPVAPAGAAAELQKLQMQPVLEDGRIVGVRLLDPGESGLLARYGLSSSDVIVAVNGIPLDGPGRGRELLESLRNAQRAELRVRRPGQSEAALLVIQP